MFVKLRHASSVFQENFKLQQILLSTFETLTKSTKLNQTQQSQDQFGPNHSELLRLTRKPSLPPGLQSNYIDDVFSRRKIGAGAAFDVCFVIVALGCINSD